MVVNRFDGSGIGEGERDLNVAGAVRHHAGGQALAEARELSEEAAVIGVNLQRLDADAFDEIRGVGFGDDLAEGLIGAATDGHLDAISGSEGNYFFSRLLSC